MPNLFSPFKIKGLELRNRFMRSATYDGTADDEGKVTEASEVLYRDLAEGGVGLIVTGHAFISIQGRASFGQYGVYDDEMIPGLHHLAEIVHAAGAKIALQITHAGINSRYHASRHTIALAPSLVEGTQTAHRAMVEEEVEGIITDFGAAAARAKEAGFDAIQLHGAHGYLMSQFLSPLYNHRTDRWGGSTEKQRQFHLDVIKAVRSRVGNDYPLFMKFGVMDDRDGGVSLEEGVEAAHHIVAAGLDALEISAGVGGGSSRASKTDGENAEPEVPYFRERAASVKRSVSVPVMVVGGIRSIGMAQNIIDAAEADMVSLCRPLIREPALIRRWESGDFGPARCISCSRCFGVIEREGGLGCYQERYSEKQTAR
ncbi:MAG: NADH:flavin oxidoreductase [Chloroflexi bacterium]|nr:NADH:flavin oxidoreductase [Chloroflexota bacterium]